MTMTMGIVLVACLATRIVGSSPRDEDINLELHEFGHKAWDTVRLPLGVAKLDHDVFSINITELSQPAAKCLNVRPWRRGNANHSHVSYPRDFLRLLRLGRQSKCYEQSA
jgi:hypothetical protein